MNRMCGIVLNVENRVSVYGVSRRVASRHFLKGDYGEVPARSDDQHAVHPVCQGSHLQKLHETRSKLQFALGASVDVWVFP